MRPLAALSALIIPFVAGCSGNLGVSGPVPRAEPTFSLRKDFYHNLPVWESNLLSIGDGSKLNITAAQKQLSASDIVSLSKVSQYTSPGLYVLLKQVNPQHPLLASAADEQQILNWTSLKQAGALTIPTLGGQSKSVAFQDFQANFVANNANPLPARLANLPLTKGYITSLAEAHYNANVIGLARNQQEATSLKHQQEDQEFKVNDFRSFAEGFTNANLDMIQTGVAPTDSGAERWQRVQRMNAVDTNGFSPSTTSLGITWDGVAFQYFAAYYQGNFVDRTGGKLTKPDLGKKISNETITSAVTVGLESIYDFAVLAGSTEPADKAIKAPIIYTEPDPMHPDPAKESWQTADHNMPSLAILTQKILKQDYKKNGLKPWPYVVEIQLTDPNNVGITASKLKLSRYVSGIAGDGAGSLSGLISRTFGGIHIGFVLLGKVSVGDNDTLSKLIETIVESVARRASDLFVSNVLYSVTYQAGAPDMQKDPPLVILLKIMDQFDSGTAE